MNTVSEACGFPVFDATSSLEHFLVVDEEPFILRFDHTDTEHLKVQFPIFIFLRISKV